MDPCVFCGKPTTSHRIQIPGLALLLVWQGGFEVDFERPIQERLTYVGICCHSCWDERELEDVEDIPAVEPIGPGDEGGTNYRVYDDFADAIDGICLDQMRTVRGGLNG